MAVEYITREGDMLDHIAWKHYGATDNRVVEQLLEANRGIADLGARLPGGVRIVLPVIAQPAQQEGVRLWD